MGAYNYYVWKNNYNLKLFVLSVVIVLVDVSVLTWVGRNIMGTFMVERQSLIGYVGTHIIFGRHFVKGKIYVGTPT